MISKKTKNNFDQMDKINVPLRVYSVIKPPLKQKMLEQTPVGMANSTPLVNYVPKGHKKEKKKFK